MLAVIKTGGKQYLVSPKQKIEVEKIEKQIGEEIVFDKILLVEKGKKIEIGTPFVEGAKVVGKVISQKKRKKVTIFKYRPKRRYRKKRGHRQPVTAIEILKIEI